MTRKFIAPFLASVAATGMLLGAGAAVAGQAPLGADAPDIAISHRDRVYAAEQYSNTVSVIDPASNELLGEIHLGDPQPRNLSPLYNGQVLVHGLGFAPDGKTLAVVATGSNSVSFIDTATNTVKHTTYLGRSPHEAFYTPDGAELWVTVRGEDYISILDARTYEEKMQLKTPSGPGMQIFSPDGAYAYVCSSFNPETKVFSIKDHQEVATIEQASPFCPNISASPDGTQVWFTLKDIGKTQVVEARPPFKTITTIDTGPITNHVNFASVEGRQLAYVTIGGLNEVKVYDTADFSQVATIPVGDLPHGLWPSGDGTRIYVGLENAAEMAVIDTASNTMIKTIPIGQAPQAVVYVPNAVPADQPGTDNLQPLGDTGKVAHLALAPVGENKGKTTVALFDQGLTQVLEASVTGLEPGMTYALALSASPDGSGDLQPLATFKANPAGASIVNAVGPIRQIVDGDHDAARRYLVIAQTTDGALGAPVQLQSAK